MLKTSQALCPAWLSAGGIMGFYNEGANCKTMIQGTIIGACRAFLMVGLAWQPIANHSAQTPVPTPPTANFSVKPTDYTPPGPNLGYFIFNIAPGQSFQSQVLIVNKGGASGTAIISAVDGLTGATSGIVYADNSAPRQDVGSWIILDETQVTLQPGGQAIVHFHGTVPQTAWVGQHVGGIAVENATTTASSPSSNIQIKTVQRTIIAVEIDNPGASVERLELSNAQFGGGNGQQILTLNLQNSGELFLQPTGTVTITDGSGKKIQSIPVKMDKILPHSSLAYPIALSGQALAPGDYQAIVSLTYGKTNQSLQVTKPFTVTAQAIVQTFGEKAAKQYLAGAFSNIPWWAYALIGIGVLLLVGLGLQVVLMRRKMRQQVTATKVNAKQSTPNRAASQRLMPDAMLPLGDTTPQGSSSQQQRSSNKLRETSSAGESDEMTRYT
jgi:hypothetical protein